MLRGDAWGAKPLGRAICQGLPAFKSHCPCDPETLRGWSHTCTAMWAEPCRPQESGSNLVPPQEGPGENKDLAQCSGHRLETYASLAGPGFSETKSVHGAKIGASFAQDL